MLSIPDSSIIFSVLLVDGNNLMYALAAAGMDVGREGLCKLLDEMMDEGRRIAVVFDGPPPRADSPSTDEQTAIDVYYSSSRSADEIVVERIAENTAPRRSTVVSTD